MNDVTVNGWMTEDERLLLKRLAFGKKVLELGSYEGLSTINMLQTAQQVTAVDTFDGRATPAPRDTLRTFVDNVNAAGLLSRLKIRQGTTEEILPKLKEEGERYGLIFIDADHSYEAVKQDIELSLPLLAEGGTLAFHDYGTGAPGVMAAVDAFLAAEKPWLEEQQNALVAFRLKQPEKSLKSPTVYLTMPHRDLQVHLGAAEGLHFASHNKLRQIIDNGGMSVLTLNFNTLFCNALNARVTEGVTHFAMLHNDVVPCRGWLDILMAEMNEGDYDCISAVVPLKNDKGLTSTGLCTGSQAHVRRLTLSEVFELPETFMAHDVPYRMEENPLLLNTGCWLMRLDRPWVQGLHFRQQDNIAWSLSERKFVPSSTSEDWDFSRQLHSRGCRIAATRKVKLFHQAGEYNNHSPWGKWKTDETYHEAERVVAEYEAANQLESV